MFWPALFLFLFLQGIDYNAEGIKALDAQKYDLAVENFKKAVAADPKDYTAQFNLAFAYTQLGQAADAIPIYKTVLELKPGLYQAQLNLGILLVRGKQFAEAAQQLRAAAEAKPKEYRPALYLAEALLAQGQAAEAEPFFRTALEVNPKSADAELGLGRAQARQNRLADAAPHFRKAAELDPNHQDSLLELASLYEDAKHPEEAIAIYRQFPSDLGAQEHMGRLLLDGNRAAEAIPALEATVQKAPTTANRLVLAQAYLAAKQHDKGLPLLAQTVQAEPRDYALHMLYGRALRDHRDFAPAAKEFLTSAQLKPDSVEAWSELAAVLLINEDYPQALAALDRVKAIGGEKKGHVYFRALALDKMHQLKPALESYEKFLEMSNGTSPEEEFLARQRVRIIEYELSRR